MTTVSIIVPIYNTEAYLEKCLDSLIGQTLKDIEIICINDGSTDNSAQILQNYSFRDKRIRVIEQKHLKQGAARNNGFKAASGEYIGYVDSDDWVDLEYFEKLYNAAKKYGADIALAANVRVGRGKSKKRLNITKEEFFINLQDKFDTCKQPTNGCPTNKIYKRSLLEKHNIQYPEGMYCEDKLFTTQAVYFANGIVTVPDVFYYYYRRPDSTVCSQKTNPAILRDKIKSRQDVLKFLREQNADVRDKEFWAVKEVKKFAGITIYLVKESLKTERHYLFGFIPFSEVRRGR